MKQLTKKQLSMLADALNFYESQHLREKEPQKMPEWIDLYELVQSELDGGRH